MFEYLAYIAFLRKKKFRNVNGTEQRVIQMLKADTTLRDLYLNKISPRSELRKSWKKIKDELAVSPLGDVSGGQDIPDEVRWWNCSHTEMNQRTLQEERKRVGVIHSYNDWENMIQFWTAIRHNMFHGGKDPQNNRDKLLVQHGYATLRPLVEILLAQG